MSKRDLRTVLLALEYAALYEESIADAYFWDKKESTVQSAIKWAAKYRKLAQKLKSSPRGL